MGHKILAVTSLQASKNNPSQIFLYKNYYIIYSLWTSLNFLWFERKENSKAYLVNFKKASSVKYWDWASAEMFVWHHVSITKLIWSELLMNFISNGFLSTNCFVHVSLKDFPKIQFEKMGLEVDKYRKKLPTPAEAGRLKEQDPWKPNDTDKNFGT